MRRAKQLQEKGLHFVDVGTSGGIWGLSEGYSLMIGGEAEVVARLKPIFQTLAPGPDKGWGHVGPHGAGHFVKMIHNGIEYGLMQAYAEGFDLMQHKTEFGLDLRQIAEIWRYGSVVRSWLLDLTARALAENPTMEGIASYVEDSGEGRWTVAEAIELGCAIPVITIALQRRFLSRVEDPFSDKLLAAMRQQFGGHEVRKEGS
jgi:6-phosphogluconate dehydrogenase